MAFEVEEKNFFEKLPFPIYVFLGIIAVMIAIALS